jgi:predicted RNA-binding Zn ribbon-like protein
MVFAHDSELFLRMTATLVNTDSGGVDQLASREGLGSYLESAGWSGVVLGTDAERTEVRAMRDHLREFWHITDRDAAARFVNDLLAQTDARPYLTRHEPFDWHLHLTRDNAPLASRIGAEAAMGFLDLIREDQLDRLRTCAADDCEDVLVDLSRNHSKLYCDSRNCGNRANVAAYRARKRAAPR